MGLPNPSRETKFSGANGEGNINIPCSADHEQDWQPYPVDAQSPVCDDAYIHTLHIRVYKCFWFKRCHVAVSISAQYR